MRVYVIYALFSFLFISKNSFGSSPPNPYVDKGACPFECCKYKEWLVVNDTALYEKIGGKKQIEVLRKGTKAHALTGEVYVEPNPVEIVFGKGKYAKGEKLYLLTTQGEGFYKAWHQGKIDSIEVIDLFDNSGNPKNCSDPSKECWGRPTKAIREQKRDWWIKFKAPSGKTGWSDKPNNFSENDSCS
jgi:hypothetical protein